MDTKTYSEIVLPPEKGTGIKPAEKAPDPEATSVPKPREFRMSSSVVRKKRASEAGRQSADADTELLDDAVQPSTFGAAKFKERAQTHKTTSRPTESRPVSSNKVARTQRKEDLEASNDSTGESRDFIVAYDDQFVGYYRAYKRITNQKAFLKIANRIGDSIAGFDLDKLEIYKPVPLKVKHPESLDEGIQDESFDWFLGKDSDQEI
jgi:hypothetical protein